MNSIRYRVPVLAVVALVLVISVAFAAEFLLDFYGYDYWDPWTAPMGAPGDCYNALGFVPVVNPTYLTFDYGTFEYTFSLQSVCLTNITPIGDYTIFDFSGGTFDVYCDSLVAGTAGDFGTNPPNATAPATFTDGECVIGGDVSGLQIVLDNTTGNADLSGMLDLVRGTQLGNIPVEQRGGWTLAGLRADAPDMPMGYFWQIDGQLFIDPPVPVEKGSWGSLKSRFQGGE